MSRRSYVQSDVHAASTRWKHLAYQQNRRRKLKDADISNYKPTITNQRKDLNK